MLTEGSDPVHKVTIIPRGMALGLTQTLPVEDRLNYTRKQIIAIIKHAIPSATTARSYSTLIPAYRAAFTSRKATTRRTS